MAPNAAPALTDLVRAVQMQVPAIAHTWYQALLGDAATLAQPELDEATLRAWLVRFVALIDHDESRADGARALGAELAALEGLPTDALARTVGRLGQLLVAELPPAEATALAPVLFGLFGALIAGYDAHDRATPVDARARAGAEEQSRESRYEQLVHLLPDLIIIHRDRRIIFANAAAAQVLGVDSADDLLGRDPISLALPAYRAGHESRLRRMLAGERVEPVETRVRRRDGTEIDLGLETLLIDDHGRDTVLIVGRDITQRKTAEAAIARARAELESRVEARTRELAEVNTSLEAQIAERTLIERQLRRRNTELDILNAAGRTFTASLDPDEVISVVVQQLREVIQATGWFVWLTDDTPNEAICRHCALLDDTTPPPRQWLDADSLLGQVLQEGRGWLADDLATVELGTADATRLSELGARTLMLVPLITQQRAIGAIEVIDTQPGRFSARDLEFLTWLSVPAAVAIDNANLYQAAQDMLEERRRAEDALRESESRYRILIEVSPDAIIAAEVDGTIYMTNARAVELTGFTRPQEVVGRSFYAFLTPESRKIVEGSLTCLLETSVVQGMELDIQRRDGTVVPVEVSAALLPSYRAQPPAVVAIIRDVTARKETDKLLRRRNAELEALNTIAAQVGSPPGLQPLIQTAVGEALQLTGAQLAWAEIYESWPSEAAPRPPTYLVEHANGPLSDTVRHTRDQVSTRILARGEPLWAREARPEAFEPIVGTIGDCAALAVPIRARHVVIGSLGAIVGEDATAPRLTPADRRFLDTLAQQIAIAARSLHLTISAAEADLLRESDRLRSELIANFSHDLKTPLGVIKFSCTTLTREDVEFDRDTQLELLSDIDQQTDRLKGVVERVLDLGQIEEGALQLHRELTDVADLTQRLLTVMQKAIPNHRLIQEFRDLPLLVDADARRIEDVLANLVDNAVKYSPEGGDVVVRAHKTHRDVVFTIEDRGIGIPAEELSHVFDRFYRARNARDNGIWGTGLGLAVCRGIIEAHGGRIWAENRSDGGTVFSFTLPVYVERLMVDDGKPSPPRRTTRRPQARAPKSGHKTAQRPKNPTHLEDTLA